MAEDEVPKASALSTLALLVGLFVTITTVRGTTSIAIASYMAWGIGISLGVSILIDLQKGIRNLIRVDVMALFSLYFLTFFEFLLPQSALNEMILPFSMMRGCTACVWGFTGLAIGRHLAVSRSSHFAEIFERPVSPGFIIRLYWFCFAMGYFYMLMTVHFNPIEMVSQFMEARFSQPWTRGRFGDWRALLGEFALFIYVIPAISGVILAKKDQYTKTQLYQVMAGFGFTLFHGFVGGTRNVFASYLVTFLIGYAFSLKRTETKKLLVVTGIVAVSLLVATRVMLEFRTIGFKYYIQGELKEMRGATDENEFFVDYNLYVICSLAEIFPDRYHYLKWEIPYLAVIRPIPRAIWPKKPEGLSISFEEALGVEGLTLASSFVGEGYISYGNTGVFLTGLFFGMLCGWWGRMGSPRNSDFGVLVYASGFFAAVISMRSMFVFSTAILPTMAALLSGQFLISRVEKKRVPISGGKRNP